MPPSVPPRLRPGLLPLLPALALALAAGVVQARQESEGSLPPWDEGRPHHASVLGGVTDDGETSAATFGIDYEYRLNRRLGVGAVAEHAAGDLRATTVLAVADVHLWRGLVLQTGPGAEWLDPPEAPSEREFVYRIGLLYEWDLGGLTLSPQIHGDIVPGGESDALVFVLAIGRAF